MYIVLTAPIDTDTDTGLVFRDKGEILSPDQIEILRHELGDTNGWMCAAIMCFDLDTALSLQDAL